MAKIFVVKTFDNHLVPSSDTDYERIKNLKSGEIYRAEIHKPRNIRFHRKFFALLQYTLDSQEQYQNLEDLRIEIELKCGNYNEHITTKGKIVYIPKSIAFDKMDELTFEELYNKAIDVVLKDFIVGDTEENINEQVNRIMGFV